MCSTYASPGRGAGIPRQQGQEQDQEFNSLRETKATERRSALPPGRAARTLGSHLATSLLLEIGFWPTTSIKENLARHYLCSSARVESGAGSITAVNHCSESLRVFHHGRSVNSCRVPSSLAFVARHWNPIELLWLEAWNEYPPNYSPFSGALGGDEPVATFFNLPITLAVFLNCLHIYYAHG